MGDARPVTLHRYESFPVMNASGTAPRLHRATGSLCPAVASSRGTLVVGPWPSKGPDLSGRVGRGGAEHPLPGYRACAGYPMAPPVAGSKTPATSPAATSRLPV